MQLRDRKVRNIAATGADIVATGNIGCMTQIAGRAGMPIVHTVNCSTGPMAGRSRRGFSGAPTAKTEKGSAAIAARCPLSRPSGATPQLLRCPPRIHMTITLVPTLTRSKRSTTSSLRKRMQPDETLVPIVHGALVPWMR